MNTEQKPEALQPAEKLRDAINRIELGFSDAIATNDLRLAAMELESLHARVQELEAKEAKPAPPVVWPEPVGRVTTGPHGLFFAYDNVITATPKALYTSAQVEAMLEAQG